MKGVTLPEHILLCGRELCGPGLLTAPANAQATSEGIFTTAFRVGVSCFGLFFSESVLPLFPHPAWWQRKLSCAG